MKDHLSLSARRSFLKMIGTSVAAGAGAVLATLTIPKAALDLEELLRKRKDRVRKREHLLQEIFFKNLYGNIHFSLSSDHINWGNKRCFSSYPDVKDTVISLSSIADISPEYEYCFPDFIHDRDAALVCIGSQASNSATRLLMENSKVHRANILKIGEKTIDLKYNNSLQKTETLTRVLAGKVVEENNWAIVDRRGNQIRSKLSGPKQEPVSGYLLFSKLPHPLNTNNSCVVWSGNIGPSTEALRLIFDSDQFVNNSDLQHIHATIKKYDYYQILFDVKKIEYNTKYQRHFPKEIYVNDISEALII